MTRVTGDIVLPADAPAGKARVVRIEVRDVSALDAPSTVIASTDLRDVDVAPRARVPFAIDVPDVDPARHLNVRAHVDVAGTGRVSTGDYLTTESVPVPRSGGFRPIVVPVTRT